MIVEALCVALVGAWVYDSYSKNTTNQEIVDATQTKASPQIIESAITKPVIYADWADNQIKGMLGIRPGNDLAQVGGAKADMARRGGLITPEAIVAQAVAQQNQSIMNTQMNAANGTRVNTNPAPVPTIMRSIVPLTKNITNSVQPENFKTVDVHRLGSLSRITPIFGRAPIARFSGSRGIF